MTFWIWKHMKGIFACCSSVVSTSYVGGWGKPSNVSLSVIVCELWVDWWPHEYGTVVVTTKPTLLLIDLWFIIIIILWTSEGLSLRFVPAYFQMSLVSPSLFWLSTWLVSECQFWNTTNFKLHVLYSIMWLDDWWIEKDVKGNDYGLF
jgi:hypothetical protein